MFNLILFNLFSIINADILTTVYTSPTQFFSCLSGLECFSHTIHCSTSPCALDAKLTVPSGQNLVIDVNTRHGTTSQFSNWGNVAVEGQAGVSGPYSDTFFHHTCTSNPTAELFLRVYCYSSSCIFGVTLSQSWAKTQCGITWKTLPKTECDSSCRQLVPAVCYYTAVSGNAPDNSSCIASIGTYEPVVTVCPIDASCGPDSVCLGPYPNTCVNLCDNFDCGENGNCSIVNAQPRCTCDTCYSGDNCQIAPVGIWANKSWSSCNCEDAIQVREVSCETPLGCVLPFSACSGSPVVKQSCTPNCPLTLEDIYTPVKERWFFVTLIGAPSLLLICCIVCSIKRRGKKHDKKGDHAPLPTVPDAAPDNRLGSSVSGYNYVHRTPSHLDYRQPSPLDLSAQPSFRFNSASFPQPVSPSHPMTPSNQRSMGHRPITPRPMTPESMAHIPEEVKLELRAPSPSASAPLSSEPTPFSLGSSSSAISASTPSAEPHIPSPSMEPAISELPSPYSPEYVEPLPQYVESKKSEPEVEIEGSIPPLEKVDYNYDGGYGAEPVYTYGYDYSGS